MFRPIPQRALQPSGQPRTNMVSSTQHGCSKAAVAAPASKALQRPRPGTTQRVPRLITAPPAPPSKVEMTEQARGYRMSPLAALCAVMHGASLERDALSTLDDIHTTAALRKQAYLPRQLVGPLDDQVLQQSHRSGAR